MIPLYRTNSYLFEHDTVADAVLDEDEHQFVICRELIFAEGGGQPADRGTISWNGETREVLALIKHKGDVKLKIRPISGLKKGETVKCSIDSARRTSIMRLHTAQHGFAGAMRRLLSSYHAGGMSIDETAATCTMRFESARMPEARVMTDAIEILGEAIDVKRKVHAEIFDSAEVAARALGDLLRPSDPRVQLKGKARIVIIDGLDANACGGTHLRDFSEVKGVEIVDVTPSDESHFSLKFKLK